jgi:hypothetical protein
VLIGVAALALLGHSSSKPSARIASQSATQHKQAKGSRASASHRRRHTRTRSSSGTPAAAGTASAAAPASTTASAPSTTAASSPASASAEALQAQGHQELAAGSYSQAISSLQQALHAADPSSLTYAYALYDLGRALTLSGDPQAAIPILEQRLRIPNQTAVVQQALDEARRAAGQSGAAATNSSAPSSPAAPAPSPAKPKDSHGQGRGSSESGGAGVSPGHSKHGD